MLPVEDHELGAAASGDLAEARREELGGKDAVGFAPFAKPLADRVVADSRRHRGAGTPTDSPAATIF